MRMTSDLLDNFAHKKFGKNIFHKINNWKRVKWNQLYPTREEIINTNQRRKGDQPDQQPTKQKICTHLSNNPKCKCGYFTNSHMQNN